MMVPDQAESMLLTVWINRQGQSEIPSPFFIEEAFLLKGSEEIGEWPYFFIGSARWLILQGFSDLFSSLLRLNV